LILAATTSTYDSGLLDSLLAAFSREHPDIRVRTVVTGSGQALELGRRGDADVLLVHAPAAETRFVRAGYAAERVPVMENDFLILGPAADPAGIRGLTDPPGALARIAAHEATFLSRGDSSGTHERELAIWALAGVRPAPRWYLESGQGQGTTLQIASERRAYTMSDRATFGVLEGIVDLVPLVQGHASLVNRYSAILPTASAHPAEASTLIRWLTSEPGRRAIADFRRDRAGVPLFSPVVSAAPDPEPGDTPRADTDPAATQDAPPPTVTPPW